MFCVLEPIPEEFDVPDELPDVEFPDVEPPEVEPPDVELSDVEPPDVEFPDDEVLLPDPEVDVSEVEFPVVCVAALAPTSTPTMRPAVSTPVAAMETDAAIAVRRLMRAGVFIPMTMRQRCSAGCHRFVKDW